MHCDAKGQRQRDPARARLGAECAADEGPNAREMGRVCHDYDRTFRSPAGFAPRRAAMRERAGRIGKNNR